MTAAAAVLTNPTFTLADRLKVQNEIVRTKAYTIIGRLTAVLFEAQRSTRGLSGSRPRYHSSEQIGKVPESMTPFSERQTVLWSSITLDWLTHKNAPAIAISRDRQDLLLPYGMTPLPDIPNPLWTPDHALQACPNSKSGCSGCIAPRIPQTLTGCRIVGDRVTDMIRARDGRKYGVLHPIVELSVMLHGVQGAFGRIRGGVNPADGTHLAMLIDDSDPNHLQAYFVGGRFQLGG